MKSLKVIIAVLVVLVATVFIYSCAKDGTEKQSDVLSEDLRTETRAGEPCEDALGNCNMEPWIPAVATNISIGLYPGCTFEVSYKYRICPFSGKLDVLIDQIADWPPCSAFRTDYAVDPFVISKAEKQIMTELVKILVLNPLVNIPNCSSGRSTSFGFSTSSCINFCIIPLGTQTTQTGELIKVGYVKIPCGEACCKTTYEVCRKANGDIDITPSISQGTGNCSGQSPNLPCPLNSTGSTGCIPNCYLL